jgi:Asp/Glu/hydantoin racemase
MDTIRTMRIWYQSITELDALPDYRAALLKMLADIAPSGVEIVPIGLDAGTYRGGAPIDTLRYPRELLRVASQVVEKAEAAEREGFDAFLIGSFVAPGMSEARAAVDIPVLSMAEIAVLATRHIAKSVRLVCLNRQQARLVEDLMAELGLDGAGLEVRHLNLLDESVLSTAIVEPDEVASLFVASCADLEDSRADVIIPAEGILSMVVKAAGLREVSGRPVVDVFDAAITAAVGAAGLYRRGALTTGRIWSYPRL